MPVVTPHVPDGLIDVMKALTKCILKQKPENMYQFAVEHFETLIIERDGRLDKGYERFRLGEGYFKSKEKYEFCSGKFIANKTSKKTDKPPLSEKDAHCTQSFQPKFKARKLSSRKPSEILIVIKEEDDGVSDDALKTEIESEMKKRERAALKIQKVIKTFLAEKREPIKKTGMSQQVAAYIIQRTLRTLFSKKLIESNTNLPLDKFHMDVDVNSDKDCELQSRTNDEPNSDENLVGNDLVDNKSGTKIISSVSATYPEKNSENIISELIKEGRTQTESLNSVEPKTMNQNEAKLIKIEDNEPDIISDRGNLNTNFPDSIQMEDQTTAEAEALNIMNVNSDDDLLSCGPEVPNSEIKIPIRQNSDDLHPSIAFGEQCIINNQDNQKEEPMQVKAGHEFERDDDVTIQKVNSITTLDGIDSIKRKNDDTVPIIQDTLKSTGPSVDDLIFQTEDMSTEQRSLSTLLRDKKNSNINSQITGMGAEHENLLESKDISITYENQNKENETQIGSSTCTTNISAQESSFKNGDATDNQEVNSDNLKLLESIENTPENTSVTEIYHVETDQHFPKHIDIGEFSKLESNLGTKKEIESEICSYKTEVVNQDFNHKIENDDLKKRELAKNVSREDVSSKYKDQKSLEQFTDSKVKEEKFSTENLAYDLQIKNQEANITQEEVTVENKIDKEDQNREERNDDALCTRKGAENDLTIDLDKLTEEKAALKASAEVGILESIANISHIENVIEPKFNDQNFNKSLAAMNQTVSKINQPSLTQSNSHQSSNGQNTEEKPTVEELIRHEFSEISLIQSNNNHDKNKTINGKPQQSSAAENINLIQNTAAVSHLIDINKEFIENEINFSVAHKSKAVSENIVRHHFIADLSEEKQQMSQEEVSTFKSDFNKQDKAQPSSLDQKDTRDTRTNQYSEISDTTLPMEHSAHIVGNMSCQEEPTSQEDSSVNNKSVNASSLELENIGFGNSSELIVLTHLIPEEGSHNVDALKKNLQEYVPSEEAVQAQTIEQESLTKFLREFKKPSEHIQGEAVENVDFKAEDSIDSGIVSHIREMKIIKEESQPSNQFKDGRMFDEYREGKKTELNHKIIDGSNQCLVENRTNEIENGKNLNYVGISTVTDNQNVNGKPIDFKLNQEINRGINDPLEESNFKLLPLESNKTTEESKGSSLYAGLNDFIGNEVMNPTSGKAVEENNFSHSGDTSNMNAFDKKISQYITSNPLDCNEITEGNADATKIVKGKIEIDIFEHGKSTIINEDNILEEGIIGAQINDMESIKKNDLNMEEQHNYLPSDNMKEEECNGNKSKHKNIDEKEQQKIGSPKRKEEYNVSEMCSDNVETVMTKDFVKEILNDEISNNKPTVAREISSPKLQNSILDAGTKEFEEVYLHKEAGIPPTQSDPTSNLKPSSNATNSSNPDELQRVNNVAIDKINYETYLRKDELKPELSVGTITERNSTEKNFLSEDPSNTRTEIDIASLSRPANKIGNLEVNISEGKVFLSNDIKKDGLEVKNDKNIIQLQTEEPNSQNIRVVPSQQYTENSEKQVNIVDQNFTNKLYQDFNTEDSNILLHSGFQKDYELQHRNDRNMVEEYLRDDANHSEKILNKIEYHQYPETTQDEGHQMQSFDTANQNEIGRLAEIDAGEGENIEIEDVTEGQSQLQNCTDGTVDIKIEKKSEIETDSVQDQMIEIEVNTSKSKKEEQLKVNSPKDDKFEVQENNIDDQISPIIDIQSKMGKQGISLNGSGKKDEQSTEDYKYAKENQYTKGEDSNQKQVPNDWKESPISDEQIFEKTVDYEMLNSANDLKSDKELENALETAAITIQKAYRKYVKTATSTDEKSNKDFINDDSLANMETIALRNEATSVEESNNKITIVQTNNKVDDEADEKGIWYVGEVPIIPSQEDDIDDDLNLSELKENPEAISSSTDRGFSDNINIGVSSIGAADGRIPAENNICKPLDFNETNDSIESTKFIKEVEKDRKLKSNESNEMTLIADIIPYENSEVALKLITSPYAEHSKQEYENLIGKEAQIDVLKTLSELKSNQTESITNSFSSLETDFSLDSKLQPVESSVDIVEIALKSQIMALEIKDEVPEVKSEVIGGNVECDNEKYMEMRDSILEGEQIKSKMEIKLNISNSKVDQLSDKLDENIIHGAKVDENSESKMITHSDMMDAGSIMKFPDKKDAQEATYESLDINKFKENISIDKTFLKETNTISVSELSTPYSNPTPSAHVTDDSGISSSNQSDIEQSSTMRGLKNSPSKLSNSKEDSRMLEESAVIVIQSAYRKFATRRDLKKCHSPSNINTEPHAEISTADDSDAETLRVNSIKDDVSDVEHCDMLSYGEDSLEAMYYSLRRNELLLDRMHQQASECKSATKERPERPDFDGQLNISVKSMDEIQRTSERGEDIGEQELTTVNKDLDSEVNEIQQSNYSGDSTTVAKIKQDNSNGRNFARNESYYSACNYQPITSASITPNKNPNRHCSGNSEELFTNKAQSVLENLNEPSTYDECIDALNTVSNDSIRRNMLAYSTSEADSDYWETAEEHIEAIPNNDFNISTAFETMASTDTDSTIVSAATKIQAGARGFLTRRRLRRASLGTTSFSERKASFGNEAISESLEDLIDEQDAAVKIQKSFRRYRNRKTRQSAPVLRKYLTQVSSKSKDSSEERILGITDVKLEHKPNADSNDGNEQIKLTNDANAKSVDISYVSIGQDNFEAEKNDVGVNLDGLKLAARRTTLQRGDAVQRNSTPEDDSGSSGSGQTDNVESSKTFRTESQLNVERKKRFGPRQRTMPVQIDSDIMRVLPKHLRKRIRSADVQNKRSKYF